MNLPTKLTIATIDLNPAMDQSSPPASESSRMLEKVSGEEEISDRQRPTSKVNVDMIVHDEHSDTKVIEEQGAKDSLQTVDYDDPRDSEEFLDLYDDPEQLNEVQERLALCRIRAHKLIWEGKELDMAQLKGDYTSDTLRDEDYFKQYELNCEWYDYQRLVLHNDLQYIAWESYHTTCATLKSDLEYLQFYDELWSKLKSIDDDGVERTKEHFDAQHSRYYVKARTEAPKIAARFCNIDDDLVHMGITDCKWSAMFDLAYHKDLDCIFFEIWKRVAKYKMDFRDALVDLFKLDLYPLQHVNINAEFEEHPMRSIKMKEGYYSHVAHIDENVSEDEVCALIKEAVNKILPKPKIYVDYIRNKLEVVGQIGVIS